MTTRTTEGLKHNKHAVVPVIVSLVAFCLSLAGWWLAWICGLIVLIVWLLMLCFMDYTPHVEHVLLITFICAIIASIAELFVMANVNNSATCGNDDGCNTLSPPLKMILAAIAAILWAVVAYLTFQRYRAKTVSLPS